jgi:hypothetical protein
MALLVDKGALACAFPLAEDCLALIKRCFFLLVAQQMWQRGQLVVKQSMWDDRTLLSSKCFRFPDATSMDCDDSTLVDWEAWMDCDCNEIVVVIVMIIAMGLTIILVSEIGSMVTPVSMV